MLSLCGGGGEVGPSQQWRGVGEGVTMVRVGYTAGVVSQSIIVGPVPQCVGGGHSPVLPLLCPLPGAAAFLALLLGQGHGGPVRRTQLRTDGASISPSSSIDGQAAFLCSD